MKKFTLVMAVLLAVSLFALADQEPAAPGSEFQTIKKAVKENPDLEPGREAKWFKVLVTDAKTGKDKVRLTLPLAVIDIISRCVEANAPRLRRPGCDIDLAALFNALKAAGPMMFIELQEDDEIVKVWLE